MINSCHESVNVFELFPMKFCVFTNLWGLILLEIKEKPMPRGKQLTTQIVLERAFELACVNGIGSITYNGLARELDIRPQSMYRYVKDIRELRVWLLSEFLAELVEKIDAAMKSHSPAQALRQFSLTMYDECHANPRYYETFELMHSYEIIPDLREPLISLAGLVQKPMEELKGQTSDAMRHTQLFVAVNLGYAQMAMTRFIPTSLQDDRDMFIRSIDEFIGQMIVR